MFKTILLSPFKLLALLFGRFSWQAPAWLFGIKQSFQQHPRAALSAVAGILLLFGGYLYFQSLPKPISITAHLDAPGVTPAYDDALPDTLTIEFSYDFSALGRGQPRPTGKPSAARIDLVGEEVTQGISLSPAKPGRWQWLDDRRLQFTPESDWPAGTEYQVNFDSSVFNTDARLSRHAYEFVTPELEVEFAGIQFYQDPQEISVRRVVATVKFTHPVDQESFEKHLSMSMRPSDSTIDVKPAPYTYSVSYDKNKREAYIQSEPVSLPAQSNYMTIAVNQGVKSLLGGEGSHREAEDRVLIPDIYSFLKVSSAQSRIIRNDKDEPEQILILEFTDDIDEQELLSKLSLHLLPKKNPKKNRTYWSSPREVSDEILRNSDKLELKAIPNERNFSKLYSFAIDVPENRYVYLKIDSGLSSVNKFIHSSFYDSLIRTPKYPKEVNIVGEGSLLTYSGDRSLSVLARGVPGIKYKVGKLLKGQLYHLISQTRGDISSPDFNNWSFNEENLAEFQSVYVDLNSSHPKEANYSSLNLSRYMPYERDRFGLFFVEAQAWDKNRNRAIYGASDKRLVLVTDLGLIVKGNTNDTHHVFVQSIQQGKPVAGAEVELLGKNGQPIYTRTTSSDGHVLIPSTKGFKDEKQPTVYVVKTDKDIAFIPFQRSSRQINLSKFDIGGISARYLQDDALNAYLFSDRGIYRPGETINIGAIVKYFNLDNIENIPLEVVVRSPRNNIVAVSRVMLPENGFFDYQYQTETTSDTGRYSVSLHLVRDNKHRGKKIGSADFTLEEFQPDTMKIESRLADVPETGWTTQEQISAHINLKNLFGVPAQDRKVKGQVVIKPFNFNFKAFADYHFTDPHFNKDKKPLSINEALETQQTDADGKAVFDIDLQRFKEGTYGLHFIAEGFDQAGGRSVTASNSALISPLTHIIGYKADGKLDFINSGAQRVIDFIAVSHDLKQVEHTDLVLRQYEIQHVSTLTKQRNGTYQYQTVKKERPLYDGPLTISASGYQHAVDSKQAGDFALEILDEHQRRLARVEYTVVGHANLAGKIDKNAELQLKLNQEDYLPGDLISMSIKAPYAGSGLITIETDRVHRYKWFKTDTESTMQSIRIPEELEGTAYVNVAFIRDVSSKEIFTSPLSYAVKPFSIDKSKRVIDVELDIAEIVRPGKPMQIAYKTSKPAKIALFAVDEGILQVAKYKQPNPLGHFLKKRALDVKTLQMLDLLLPEFSLVQALSAAGGGMDARALKALAKNLNPFSRKTDAPAVYWSGIVDAGTESRSLSFDVPNTFAGSLVVMAVAVGEAALGTAREDTIVRGPFVISPNVLTQAAPGDEFWVTVGVANVIEGSGKAAEVSVSVAPSEHLELLGEHKLQLKIDEGGEAKATFKVKAKEKLGAAELVFTARHKNEDFSRTAGLSVRPAMPHYASFESGFADGGNVKLSQQRVLFPNLAKQKVSASSSPLLIVDGLTAYLDAFPHGCTEQVVSKVFPLVGLMAHPSYSPHMTGVKEQFAQVITKLRERQRGDGGFAFWPGAAHSMEYATVYALHFLIEAQNLGYPVPGDMIERAKSYVSDYASKASDSLLQARQRAIAIYLLTRLDTVTTNFLVDLGDYLNKQHSKQWKEDITASYMAASYKLLQKDDVANALIRHYEVGLDYPVQLRDDFHSGLAFDAQYIYLLAKHFESRARELEGDVLLKLIDRIYKGEYNTISAAYSILALGAYSKLVFSPEAESTIEFIATTLAGVNEPLVVKSSPFKTAEYPVTTRELNIKGEQNLYYLNVQSGFDKTFPDKVVKEGIEIYRDFLDAEGNKVTSIAQGQEITVRLRVRALNDAHLFNIAVVDLLPGGFEVVRSSVSRTAYNWRADYVDIREDRVVYYGDFDSSVRELTYKVKPVSAGDFIVPPSYAESMYDRSIRAISERSRFSVVSDTAH